MKFSVSQTLGVVAAATFATASNSGGNPLATLDQRDLDALAIKINEDHDFAILKSEAKATFQTAHGLPISQEANSRLDAAIDELAFSSIQKAANNDPYYPKIYWVDAGPRNWFGLDVPGGRYSYDNPDCIYRTIPISSKLRYVIKGYRHPQGPTDVTFSLISDPNSQNTVASLAGDDLVVEDDGSYTITIDSSSGEGQKNHIKSTLLAKQLFVRNNLGDWNVQKPDNLTVELLDDASGQKPIDETAIFHKAQWNLQESIIDYGVGALGLKTMINPVNTLSKPSQSSTLGTLTTQASSFGHFNLKDGEAIVATLSIGEADYFVFPATDPWLVSVDPGAYQLSLNSVQSAANANGTYTFVVSRTDPEVSNWIDTARLNEGTIMVRWQGLPTDSSDKDNGVAITTQVVQLSQLASVLPAETKYVTPEQRKEQLAQRAAGYAQRLQF
ncbi:hypothetical protein V492_02042 [Pseudogymnoascus sp. VKM F-4246]|nr:hypothetical protein V492_02042 [Pseudogymnoascus sp. VKM F-4246]